MHIVTGTVIDGKVVLDGASLPEGASVTVFARETDEPVRLPGHLQSELEQALGEANCQAVTGGPDRLLPPGCAALRPPARGRVCSQTRRPLTNQCQNWRRSTMDRPMIRSAVNNAAIER